MSPSPPRTPQAPPRRSPLAPITNTGEDAEVNTTSLRSFTQPPRSPRTPSAPAPSGATPVRYPLLSRRGGARGADGESARTPEASTKRYARDSGPRIRGTGGKRGSGKKRRRRSGGERGIRDISSKLAEEDYSNQQRGAREQAAARKQRSIADDLREKESRGDEPAVGEFRPKLDGGRVRRGGGGRRMSAPARVTQPQKVSRKKACQRETCGWIPPEPGTECGTCRTKTVHSRGDKLCAACHRVGGAKPFTHLSASRLMRAKDLLRGMVEANELLAMTLVRGFSPSSDCLCQRGDCFHAALGAEISARDSRRCCRCDVFDRGDSRKRWYEVKEGDNFSWICQVCNHRKVKEAANIDNERQELDGIAMAATLTHTNVRETVARGDIVHWEDAARWLVEERRKLGETPLTGDYRRRKIRLIFQDIANAPGSDARLVEMEGRGADGRQRVCCLFPSILEDSVVVDYFLQARDARTSVDMQVCSDVSTDVNLRRVVEDIEDEDGRMAVVHAAGRIFRSDVERRDDLKNVPPRGVKHNYAAEVAMQVAPVQKTLDSLPKTVVRLFESLAGQFLKKDISRVEIRPEGNADAREKGLTGVHEDGPEERQATAPACAEGPQTEAEMKQVDATNRDRRLWRRQLLVMCTSAIKAVLKGRHIASHDVKAAQWAKSQGTTRQVIDFCAEHGLMITDSQLHKREDFHAKNSGDEDLLDKEATSCALPFDNCDVDPRMGVAKGQGPHIANIAMTAVTVGPDVARLQASRFLKDRRLLKVDDVTEGPDAEDGERRFQLFAIKFRRAAFEAVEAKSVEGGPATCLEVEIRKSLKPEKRAAAEQKYVYIQHGTTKSFKNNKEAVDRGLNVWRQTKAGKDGAPCVIAGDEETYRFLYHLMCQEPGTYRQIRRYPGDWHILLHMTKALLGRYWGAGVELVAAELCTDGKKSADGSNYRRSHHHLTVTFECLWEVCQIASFEGQPRSESMPKDDARHVDGVVEWIKERAKTHKTFRVWKQFLLHDYPAYFAFRTALRTGDFMLRLDALRRFAPVFYITGKDRYQFLVADHLAEMARMSTSDLEVMSELYSVNLGNDPFARLGLDERQEVANRFYKTLMRKIQGTYIDKLAPIAQLREEAKVDFEREFVEQPRTSRDRCREIAGLRAPAINNAIAAVRNSPAFTEAGSKEVKALDGRACDKKLAEAVLGAPEKARQAMRDVVEFYVCKNRKKRRATKAKVLSIPPKNTEAKATKSKGRTSALKDSIGNAYAGGRELKALMLNTLDAVEKGGVLTSDALAEMVASLGTTTPYCMANATGGAKHANKAAGPTKWLQDNLADGFGEEVFYKADAHGVDLPVSIHQGVGPAVLEQGTASVIKCFVDELQDKWVKDVELLVVCYDRAELVPLIKGNEQAGRTEKLGACDRGFDPASITPIPSSQFQPWLRANSKAARDGIATYLAGCSLMPQFWTGDEACKATVAFYGVEGIPADDGDGGSRDNSVAGAPGVAPAPSTGGAQDPAKPDLLRFRHSGEVDGEVDVGVHQSRGPDIGEAELSVVHFIVWSTFYFGARFTKWLVTSVDTDQWMIILLTMAVGKIKPRGDGAVQVTVKKVVGGDVSYLWVNRAFDKICKLEDGAVSSWPESGSCGWITSDDDKVRLFVLVYLLAGCDFLPAISGLPFEKMWIYALKSVRAAGLLRDSLFVEQDGEWRVDINEGAKLLATVYYFKHEAEFTRVGKSPADILGDIGDKSKEDHVEAYVSSIRLAILKIPNKRITQTCPGSISFRLQVMRADSVFGYWQDGLLQHMPKRKFEGRGWGRNPKSKLGPEEELTAEDAVLWLSDHAYVSADRKTTTLRCGCSPEKALKHKCRGCSCKARKCSIICGCRKQCLLGGPGATGGPPGDGESKNAAEVAGVEPGVAGAEPGVAPAEPGAAGTEPGVAGAGPEGQGGVEAGVDADLESNSDLVIDLVDDGCDAVSPWDPVDLVDEDGGSIASSDSDSECVSVGGGDDEDINEFFSGMYS